MTSQSRTVTHCLELMKPSILFPQHHAFLPYDKRVIGKWRLIKKRSHKNSFCHRWWWSLAMVTLPFGLCNVPCTFGRLIENILSGLTYEMCLVHLDDIIVFGKTFESKLSNVQLVFERIRQSNLKLHPDKCDLFRRQVKFLGHIVSEKGIATDPDKVKAVNEWPKPRNLKQLRSYLGNAFTTASSYTISRK